MRSADEVPDQIEREDDGRWIAEVPGLPGVMAYGEDRESAVARVQALALRVPAERLQSGEDRPEELDVLEDDALASAIQEGETSGAVSRDKMSVCWMEGSRTLEQQVFPRSRTTQPRTLPPSAAVCVARDFR